MCSQAIALAMKGIPAVYFHSLSGGENFTEGVRETGQNRTVNRRKWQYEELESVLSTEKRNSGNIFEWYTRVLRRRSSCPAFHPDASQKILDLGDDIFAFERKSLDGTQIVLCLFNFSSVETEIKNSEMILSYFKNEKAKDLIKGGDLTLSRGELTLRPYQALWLCVT